MFAFLFSKHGIHIKQLWSVWLHICMRFEFTILNARVPRIVKKIARRFENFMNFKYLYHSTLLFYEIDERRKKQYSMNMINTLLSYWLARFSEYNCRKHVNSSHDWNFLFFVFFDKIFVLIARIDEHHNSPNSKHFLFGIDVN